MKDLKSIKTSSKILVGGLITVCLLIISGLSFSAAANRGSLEDKIAQVAGAIIANNFLNEGGSDNLGYVGDSPTYLTNKRPGTLAPFSNIFTPGDLEVSGTSYLGASGFYGSATFNAGQLKSYTNATSSTATAQTLVQADILGYDTVLFTPNTNSITLTLPATSTLTSFIPTAGDMVEQCWHNATTTASKTITFAAGTGMDLQRVATSTTAGSAGVLSIPTGNSACFRFTRQTNTDIQVLMTSFIDAD